MADRIELLQAMPVFGGIEADTLQLILSRSRSRRVPRGEHFFCEGDEGSSMYVLRRGAVGVYKSWQGKDALLRTMGPGDCFGEMALIDLFPRSASVRALEDSEAIEVTVATLHAVHDLSLAQYTMIQMNMSREVSRRLRASDELLFRSLMGDARATDELQVTAI